MIKNTKNSLRSKQAGVTIIELMIGLTLGLFIIGGVLTVYIATIKSSGDTIKQSRLNQEMMTIVNIMSNDIRRAGFWANATAETSASNPFQAVGTTALDVRDASGNTSAGVQGSGDCITYAHDLNANGTVELTELFGFKLEGNDLWMRTTCAGGTACTAADANDCAKGTWARVTDPSTVSITGLTFDLADSLCVNATVTGTDCYTVTPSSGDATGEIRNVNINVLAELADDALVDASMNISVRVRNDLIRVR